MFWPIQKENNHEKHISLKKEENILKDKMRVAKAKFKVFKCEMLHSVYFCLVFDQQPKKGGETT